MAIEEQSASAGSPGEEVTSPLENGPEQASPLLLQADEVLDCEDDPSKVAKSGWVMPAIAICAILGWTSFFAFAHQPQILAHGSYLQWSEWITAWATPTLLVVGLWLLGMRHSRREADKFADVAQALSRESQRLETRLLSVNRELGLAHRLIAAQSRELEALGLRASERLSQDADRLTRLIADNGDRIDSIATTGKTALDRMQRLREELPAVTDSARELSGQIDSAGNAARRQLTELAAGFERLDEFGESRERQAAAIRKTIETALAEFEQQASQLEAATEARFATLSASSENYRSELDRLETASLEAIRIRAQTFSEEMAGARMALEQAEEQGMAALRERLDVIAAEGATLAAEMRASEERAAERWKQAADRLEEHVRQSITRISEVDAKALENARRRLIALQSELVRAENAINDRATAMDEALAARSQAASEHDKEWQTQLAQRLADFDARIAEHQREHLEHFSVLDQRSEALASRLAVLSENMVEVAAQGQEAGAGLSAAVAELTSLLGESREMLGGTDRAVADLTDASVRLLELIRAGAQHSKEDLPAAIAIAEKSLDTVEQRSANLTLIVGEATEKGRMLCEHVLTAQQATQAAFGEIAALQARNDEANESQLRQVEKLQSSLGTLARQAESLSEAAQGNLRDALDALSRTTKQVIEDLGNQSAEGIDAIAAKISAQSGEAIDRALRLRTAETIGQLEQAAAHASGVGREATLQLREQLDMVAELTTSLENRVSEVRAKAEQQVDNAFGRRMALITESLNSHAIDIAKALSIDVSDTSWAAYLRGDRGIFTRRAVRLLSSAQVKEITELFERDRDFREHVSRYIHDFEAMLRNILATRDGESISVTMLSSDIGKLYVALAQAIDRLRD